MVYVDTYHDDIVGVTASEQDALALVPNYDFDTWLGCGHVLYRVAIVNGVLVQQSLTHDAGNPERWVDDEVA
jgi:hypothetical protein